MRIAVAGGTGTVGRGIVRALAEDGHEVRALSRSSPEWKVDVRTGLGLDRALEGCDVVVNATNGPASRQARTVLVDGAQSLAAAAERAGVAHHVCVSIVGIDDFPLAYYRVKVAQEALVAAAPTPWSIVRANQFHELVAGTFAAAARLGVVPAPRGQLQPVAAAEAARAVADVAAAEPRRDRVHVCGPEVRRVAELAAAWRAATGSRAVRLPLPFPGRTGRALRAGALTCASPDVRCTTTFEDWLRSAA